MGARRGAFCRTNEIIFSSGSRRGGWPSLSGYAAEYSLRYLIQTQNMVSNTDIETRLWGWVWAITRTIFVSSVLSHGVCIPHAVVVFALSHSPPTVSPSLSLCNNFVLPSSLQLEDKAFYPLSLNVPISRTSWRQHGERQGQTSKRAMAKARSHPPLGRPAYFDDRPGHTLRLGDGGSQWLHCV